MKKQILVALVCAAGMALLTPASRASLISSVEDQTSGTTATLDQNPVITEILSQPGTVNGRTYTNWSILVNDGSGSIDLFGALPAGTSFTPAVGDALSVSGTYSPFDQIPEVASMTAVTLISTGNSVPAPLNVTIPDINITPTLPLSVAGYFLSLNNVTISGGSGNFGTSTMTLTITDPASNSMTMFYWPTSYSVANVNLNGTAIPTGPVNLTGFVDEFSGTPEFVPMTITAAAPEPASLAALGLGALALLARRRRVNRA